MPLLPALIASLRKRKEEKIKFNKLLVEAVQQATTMKPSTRRLRHRDHTAGHELIMKHYFAHDAYYDKTQFRRRFRMQRGLFLRILEDIQTQDDYFLQKRDCTGKLGLSALQKTVAAIRQLSYGLPADAMDEYVQIGESTAIECLIKFCDAVIALYKEEYLREPNQDDIERLLKKNAERGFPGMLGSLDCMHWAWKNCPAGLKGQFQGKEKEATIVLEAVASHDLWIWHASFGLPGSLNDLNVLDASHLFDSTRQGTRPETKFLVNGNHYDLGYYLVDGIYPNWATLVKAIKNPLNEKEKLFVTMQESVRKDVERAFGVLQARFAIVQGPARLWSQSHLHSIMTACIILHNMIVEDERGEAESDVQFTRHSDLVRVSDAQSDGFDTFFKRHVRLIDSTVNAALVSNLVENIWQMYGNGTPPRLQPDPPSRANP